MRKIFTALFLTMLSLFSISIFAESNYLEAKDYSTLSLQEFLNECKSQNKNAFFNKNIYTLTSDLNVLDGVSILAEEELFLHPMENKDIFLMLKMLRILR